MKGVIVGLAVALPLLTACHPQQAGVTLQDSHSNRDTENSGQRLQDLIPPSNPPH